jgi:hypothetical protein
MSVTPSHKYHETKMNKLFTETSKPSQVQNLMSATQRAKPELAMNNLSQPKYKNTSIEELKDEYNESKLSFNEENGKKELEVDIEAMILVEDKI